jgi:2-phospho-L-lactate guanylyltransferase
MSGARPDVIVAVPVKDLVDAKQRLVPFLHPDERRALAAAMLEDVLDALAPAPVTETWVVTRDAAVLAVAERHGVRCLTEAANRGHTEAVATAQREAQAKGARRFMTIPGDVPCLTAAEVGALAGALGDEPGVAFVPSRSGFGTNGVLLAPPDAMPLKFGEPSFDNHLLAARARGLRCMTLRLPGLGLDVDAPDDLAQLLAAGGPTRSAALLRTWDVPARLAAPSRA